MSVLTEHLLKSVVIETHPHPHPTLYLPPVCNKIVDHSDVVGASPVGATPTTSSFST